MEVAAVVVMAMITVMVAGAATMTNRLNTLTANQMGIILLAVGVAGEEGWTRVNTLMVNQMNISLQAVVVAGEEGEDHGVDEAVGVDEARLKSAVGVDEARLKSDMPNANSEASTDVLNYLIASSVCVVSYVEFSDLNLYALEMLPLVLCMTCWSNFVAYSWFCS